MPCARKSGGTINRAPFSRAREKVPRECEADEGSRKDNDAELSTTEEAAAW